MEAGFWWQLPLPATCQGHPGWADDSVTCPSHWARRLEELAVITNKLGSIYLIVFVEKKLFFFFKSISWVFLVSEIVSSVHGRNCCACFRPYRGPRIRRHPLLICPSLGCGTKTTVGVTWEDTSDLKCQPDSQSGVYIGDLWRMHIWYLRETETSFLYSYAPRNRFCGLTFNLFPCKLFLRTCN